MLGIERSDDNNNKTQRNKSKFLNSKENLRLTIRDGSNFKDLVFYLRKWKIVGFAQSSYEWLRTGTRN